MLEQLSVSDRKLGGGHWGVSQLVINGLYPLPSVRVLLFLLLSMCIAFLLIIVIRYYEYYSSYYC